MPATMERSLFAKDASGYPESHVKRSRRIETGAPGMNDAIAFSGPALSTAGRSRRNCQRGRVTGPEQTIGQISVNNITGSPPRR